MASQLRGFIVWDKKTTEHKKSWEFLVNAQNPSNFTRDIYHILERYYRSDGRALEADRIYHEGRVAERKLARRRGTGVIWPRRKWITDSLSKWLTGYGVHPFRQLVIWISLFAFLGVIVFWSDSALLPVKPQTGGTTEEAVLAGERVNRPERTVVEAPTASPKPATEIKPETQISPGPTPKVNKFFARFAYSLDELLPLVNLHIAEHWRPSGGWRRAYLAIHILVGWILIPLLIGAFTGMLTKN